jgi:hypothetical protein
MSLSPERIIETVCPELSGSPSLPVYLEMAAAVTSRGFFGGLYNQAVAYRAAHLFTVMKIENGSGAMEAIKELSGGAPVASMSEGGLSVSFAQAGGSAKDTALGNSKYGRMLMELIRSRPTMGVNTAGTRLQGGFC